MAVRSLTQLSFFDPRFVDPDCLEEGSIAWAMVHRRQDLFPAWIFDGWRGSRAKGRDAWPAVVLMTLLLLRWSGEGMSRRASVEQAKRNTTWRAAMGLPIGGPSPSERTVRDFERFMKARHKSVDMRRSVLFHGHVVRLCLGAGVVKSKSAWTMDSTPMYCYGAVLDTLRQLGDGVRMLAHEWARLTKTTVSVLAKEWKMPVLVGKSTKGGLGVDLKDKATRTKTLSQLAKDCLKVVTRIRAEVTKVRSSKRKGLLRRCRHLVQVIAQDLETDEAGQLVVAERVTSGRLVSVTDPQARHGRKSKSKTFNGFKVHLVGEAVSGLIAALTVTAGDAHDGAPAHRLIRQAKTLHKDLKRVLADTAYGGARLRHLVQHVEGVELLTPPPATTGKQECGRGQMTFDVQAGTATCAQGVQSSKMNWAPSVEHGVEVRRFKWAAKACNACPIREACRCEARGGHSVKLHPYEKELQQARSRWKDPEVRAEYRARTECERLVNQVTRHGGRCARAWSLGTAHLQVHVIATRSNLGVLARAWAAQERAAEEQARKDERQARKKAA